MMTTKQLSKMARAEEEGMGTKAWVKWVGPEYGYYGLEPEGDGI